MSKLEVGSTVRAPFTTDDGVTLVDKHLVVLALEFDRNGEMLVWGAYTGTLEEQHRRLPGFVTFPSELCRNAGWKTGSFYVDASRVCVVPAKLVEVEGKVSRAFFDVLASRVQSLGSRVVRTRYNGTAHARRTGYVRQDRMVLAA